MRVDLQNPIVNGYSRKFQKKNSLYDLMKNQQDLRGHQDNNDLRLDYLSTYIDI